MAILQACLLAGAMLGQAAAEGDPPDNAREKALGAFVADAKGYTMTRQGTKQERLELAPKALLHWANPARNGEDGAVFVWLLAGRPEIISSVFEFPMRGQILRKHALHSLSEQPLLADFQSAELQKTEIWSPKEPGVKFAPVPGAEPPAESPRQRLSQMRDLARQFSLEMVDLQQNKSELRLMTQPLLRYEPKAGVTKDGAIFAFAVGTDPEALLLLESRATGDAPPRWEFALARFHFVALSARHDGREVWRVEPDPDMMRTVFGRNDPQRGKIYYSVMKSVTAASAAP